VENRLATIQIRNRGTIGGNLCHSDPNGDLAPLLIALDSKVRLKRKNEERILSLGDFFVDYYENALIQNEILLEIQIKRLGLGVGAAYEKIGLRENDNGLVGVAVAIEVETSTGICKNVKVVLGGVGPIPIRAKKLELEVIGLKKEEARIPNVSEKVKNDIDPISDIQSSEAYRKEMAVYLTGVALDEAWKQATRIIDEESL
jgi:CO/xanthine dehydrogenase FAD-binding subunit